MKKNFLIPLKQNKPIKPEKSYTAGKTITLSEKEQIRYVYTYQKTKNKRRVTEVTSVGYEIKINNKWETIVYYDNDATHNNVLHRHIRISIESEKTISTTEGVKKKGTSQTFLTWCIKDLKKRHLEYMASFLNRHKKLNKKSVDIDI